MKTVTAFLVAFAATAAFAAETTKLVIPKITKPLVEAVENDPLQADYDKMWADYEEAVQKATDAVKKALDKQVTKATDSGELDLVEMWEGMQKRFAEQGQLEWDTSSKASVEWKKANPKVPYPREFNDAVRSASNLAEDAKVKLEEGYADLVKAYTKAKNVPRAKELRDEGAALVEGERPTPPQQLDKAKVFVFDGKSIIRTPVKRKVPITLEMWIKPDGQDKDVFVIGSSSQSHQGIGIGLNKGLLRAQHLIGDFGCGEIVAPGRWHHIAGTFDLSASHLFLDGKRMANGPGNQTAADSPAFVIGDIGTLYSGHHFKGQMRGIRITDGIRYTRDFTPPDRFEPREPDARNRPLLIYDAAATHLHNVTDLSGRKAHGVMDGVVVRDESK